MLRMIKGKRIILRLVDEADIEPMCRLENDVAEVGEFLPPRLTTTTELRKKHQENGLWEEDRGMLLITAPDGRFIGRIWFFKCAPYASGYEIGAKIFRVEDRGQGYMTEAVQLFCALLFESKPILRLQACAAVENKASRRTAEKAGFQLEGIKRHMVQRHGRPLDMALYSLLREECPSLKELLARE